MENCNSKLNKLTQEIIKIKNDGGHCLMALQKAQEIYGYICEDIIKIIANVFGESRETIYSIASFYSQFKLQKIGKHKISICLGTACYVRGSGDILKKCEEVLNIKEGETTKDDYFSLDTVRCVGCCAIAPVMLIDEQVFGNVTTKDVEDIINKFKEEHKD